MTKKIFVAIFLCMASLSICHAQKSTFKQELAVGASFGLNFSSVSFAPKVPTKMKLGFNGGATIRWNTEPNLGIQAELNFTQHGWEEKFEEKPQYKYSRTVNYMELPFLTHIHFGSKRVRVFVNLGPKIGYALSESTESNLNGEPEREPSGRTTYIGSPKEVRLGALRRTGNRAPHRNRLFPVGRSLLLCAGRYVQ